MKTELLAVLSVPGGIVCGLFYTLIQFLRVEIDPEKSNLIPELGHNALVGGLIGLAVGLVIYLTRNKK